MPWPQATDYNAAVQNPADCFADPELCQGQAVGDVFGLPRPHSGNFADVYQVIGPDGQSWAVKCFTRAVPGLRQRYQAISEHLEQEHRAFMVDFGYLEQGIYIRDEWYPILKMRWVEGPTLNDFIRDQVEKPGILERLAHMWLRLAKDLRESYMAHGDLQHGNVLMVPGRSAGSLALRLIDYDGMFVPALADRPSGEVGHANYQHPERLRNGGYDPEVDRFSHLVMYTAFRCLAVGGQPLWEAFDNSENLLFREQDFQRPSESKLWPALLKLDELTVRHLTGHLLQACRRPRGETPLLDDIAPGGEVRPLNIGEQAAVRAFLGMDGPNPWLPIAEPKAIEIAEAAPPSAPGLSAKSRPVGSYLPGREWFARRLVGLAAALLFLLLAGSTWLFWPARDKPGPAESVAQLLALQPATLRAGEAYTMAVHINRHGLSGRLALRCSGLPASVPIEAAVFEVDQDEAAIVFRPALNAHVPARPVTLSLWRDETQLDKCTFELGVAAVPLPRLAELQAAKLRAGEEKTFPIPINRNGSHVAVSLRVEGLQDGVANVSLAADDGALSFPLRLKAAADASGRSDIVKLSLWARDCKIDEQLLTVTVELPQPASTPRLRVAGELPITAGNTGELEVRVDRHGYEGALEVRLTGDTKGVKAQPLVLAPGESKAILSLEADGQAAEGAVLGFLAASIGSVEVDRRPIALNIRKKPVSASKGPAPLEGEFETVALTTLDQVTLRGALFSSRKGKESPGVLLLHDGGQDRRGAGWERLAAALQREGYTVLSFDFRGFGESKGISPAFWNFPHNGGLSPKLARKGEELNGAGFPADYWPYLVNDIATARSYLEELNNASKLNSNNVVVIGAGRAAALGMLWMASECCRFRNAPLGEPRPNGPEGQSLACAVWLGYQPLPMKTRMSPHKEWLELTANQVISMAFACGRRDQAAQKLAGPIAREYRARGLKIPLGQLLLLEDDAPGSALLADSENTKKIVDYLNRAIAGRRNRYWEIHDLEHVTFHYLIRGQAIVNPFGGQAFVPFDRLLPPLAGR